MGRAWRVFMPKRPRSTSRWTRGFTLVEVLVALMIAASVMVMIGGASFSLRFTNADDSTLIDTPTDKIAARRVLRQWLFALGQIEQFSGTPNGLTIVTSYGENSMSSTSIAIEVRDERAVLLMRKQGGPVHPVPSILLESDRSLRLAYLLAGPDQTPTWQDTASTAGVRAIALFEGDQILISVPLNERAKADCLVRARVGEIRSCIG